MIDWDIWVLADSISSDALGHFYRVLTTGERQDDGHLKRLTERQTHGSLRTGSKRGAETVMEYSPGAR